MDPINNNLLIFIDYTDYIDCFPMIDFHRLDTPGKWSLEKVLENSPLITVNWTPIKQSPLISGRGHLFLGPSGLFLLPSPVLNSHFVKINCSNCTVNALLCGLPVNKFRCFFSSITREV